MTESQMKNIAVQYIWTVFPFRVLVVVYHNMKLSPIQTRFSTYQVRSLQKFIVAPHMQILADSE